MILTQIEASGFRNLEGSLQLDPGLSVLYGDNAQGKTNWLEAAYVLGNTKSFRTAQLREVIRLDQEQCIIRGDVRTGSLEKRIQLVLNHESKELLVNGKRETLSRYIRNLDVFAFSLEEMEVVRGDPARRRRYIDAGIVNVAPGYLRTLSRYNLVLKQKNKLLSNASESSDPRMYAQQIDAWNEELAELGEMVHHARVDYVDKLNRELAVLDNVKRLGCERISMRYKSSLEGKGDLTRYGELLRERLALRLTAEIGAGHALVGPHRDDIEILADGRHIGRFGSAGQQRSALILLDLAAISIYNSIYEESPVLLIDDIDAELDRRRIEALLSDLEGRTQTVVSTSRRAIANRYRDRAAVYMIQLGYATKETRTVLHG